MRLPADALERCDLARHDRPAGSERPGDRTRRGERGVDVGSQADIRGGGIQVRRLFRQPPRDDHAVLEPEFLDQTDDGGEGAVLRFGMGASADRQVKPVRHPRQRPHGDVVPLVAAHEPEHREQDARRWQPEASLRGERIEAEIPLRQAAVRDDPHDLGRDASLDERPPCRRRVHDRRRSAWPWPEGATHVLPPGRPATERPHGVGQRESSAGRTRAERVGMECRDDGPAGGADEPQDRAVVAGRGLIAHGVAKQAVLVLDVHQVIPAGLCGDVGLELGHVPRDKRPPEMRRERIDVASNSPAVECGDEIAAVRGDAAWDIPCGDVQNAHGASSMPATAWPAASWHAAGGWAP